MASKKLLFQMEGSSKGEDPVEGKEGSPLFCPHKVIGVEVEMIMTSQMDTFREITEDPTMVRLRPKVEAGVEVVDVDKEDTMLT